MSPCDLCLCSEVQYVVLQNVATMSIKRRVSDPHDTVKDMHHVDFVDHLTTPDLKLDDLLLILQYIDECRCKSYEKALI